MYQNVDNLPTWFRLQSLRRSVPHGVRFSNGLCSRPKQGDLQSNAPTHGRTFARSVVPHLDEILYTLILVQGNAHEPSVTKRLISDTQPTKQRYIGLGTSRAPQLKRTVYPLVLYP